MKFRIIPNEQTPKIETTRSNNLFRTEPKMLGKYLSFAMRQHDCAGLAANQVSMDGARIMERFFAIKDYKKHFWDIIIDPEILKYKGKKELVIEGCLTWLGKKFEVYRYPSIKVKYLNLKGDIIECGISGLQAQIWQHEYDHLNGITENVE